MFGVMWAHFLKERHSAFGSIGVWLFFTLSGFLIILLRCKDGIDAGSGTLRGALAAFYVRRALRIIPVYYLGLLLKRVVAPSDVGAEMPWHLAFASNFYFFDRPFTPLTAHFWTLAVEEQFYLLWPAVILLATGRHLKPMLMAVIASAPLFRMIGNLLGWPEDGSR
jgi:peptidoglycan/LPS O-acetylase OafA/YrhL